MSAHHSAKGASAMPLGEQPTVFVSSTCYDLKQIRNDIRAFFKDQLGYEVLLSEYDSFPLDPNLTTIDNCLRAVDERADIFVLIVGCRYGSVTETGHSVTNMEYLKAKAKGIPIYAFVDKKILSALPLWRDNPDGNFQSTVDTPRLFSFVDTFRDEDGIWSFGFESAQDIINTLRIQLGYLFHDCLELRKKATPKVVSKSVLGLNGRAFQIAIIRPAAWEQKLFAQVLAVGLEQLTNYKHDFAFGITLAPTKQLQSMQEVADYISLKTDQLLRMIEVLTTLINKVLPDALGAPGVSGDADYIIYTANKFTEVYHSIIDWSLDFRTIVTEDDFQGLINSSSKICKSVLDDIERFSAEFIEKLKDVPDKMPENAEPISLSITLTLNAPDTDEFYSEVHRLQQKYGLM